MINLKGLNSVACFGPFMPPMKEDWPENSFKYASLSYILPRTTDYVRGIIEACPIEGNHKYTVVDVKVHELQPGIIPAFSNWHVDCIADPRDPAREEVHHLFVTEGCSTEFLATDTPFDLPEKFSYSIFDGLSGVKIKPYHIYTYGRHLHRATPAEKACRRLLIRVSETDKMRPQNREFEVTYKCSR